MWIIDPIDGTSFFSRQDPNWRVQLALDVEGQTEIAVVTAPALARRWWATRGGGSFTSRWPDGADLRRLQVSRRSDVAHARLQAIAGPSAAHLPAGAGSTPMSPLPLVELVDGQIDAFLAERYYLWDHAPWILIVQEAGGRFTTRLGNSRGDEGGGLYSKAALHPVLLATLGYPQPASSQEG
jgi:histidinol-phosphatase